MAWNFADGFDLYAAVADATNGYWDSQGSGPPLLQAGRFPGSRAVVNNSGGGWFLKSSGVNDAVHHFALALNFVGALGAVTSLGFYIELFDATTAQCSILVRNDGSIALLAGAPNSGTVLAAYNGAVTVANTWYAFEFEVVINNTTGSFTVRKNGNSVADFTATGLNTRGGTANNYANKIQIGTLQNINHAVDDFFWQSGASTGVWLGELRCLAMMPVSDQSVQFSHLPSMTQTNGAVASTSPVVNGTAKYTPFTAVCDGAIAAATVSLTTGYTGNLKCSIFASSGVPAPAAVLGSATVVVNPVSGSNPLTFGTPVAVTKGTQYWIGFDSDTSSGTYSTPSSGATAVYSTTAYASFPVASPTLSALSQVWLTFSVTITVGNNNCMVNEAQQDGLTTYVYDSNPGDADFYGLSALVPAGASVIATTARAYMQKSDIGTRTAAVKLKSGGTTVASPTLTLTTSGWLWDWRTDLVDPNTSAAWTVAAVNAAQIGPAVIS